MLEASHFCGLLYLPALEGAEDQPSDVALWQLLIGAEEDHMLKLLCGVGFKTHNGVKQFMFCRSKDFYLPELWKVLLREFHYGYFVPFGNLAHFKATGNFKRQLLLPNPVRGPPGIGHHLGVSKKISMF